VKQQDCASPVASAGQSSDLSSAIPKGTVTVDNHCHRCLWHISVASIDYCINLDLPRPVRVDNSPHT
jgi:hypothetical protein